MSLRTVRALFWTLIGVASLASMWPGLVLGNRVEPQILGLPFVMAWIVFWALFAGFGIVVLDRFEERERRK